MKKCRRLLSVLLVFNFIIGMVGGMKPLNLVMVVLNGLLVIIAAVIEIRKRR